MSLGSGRVIRDVPVDHVQAPLDFQCSSPWSALEGESDSPDYGRVAGIA